MVMCPWLWKLSAAGAAAVAAVVLTTGSAPNANAQAGLADWLSKAAPHVEDIHKAENAAYADGGDNDKLRADCTQLREANDALAGVMPTPDPKLTVEVQQAIDNFSSAWDSCATYLDTHNTDKRTEFWSFVRAAEHHLSSADTVLVGLARAK
ncbi:MAG: hypothetical protein ACRDTV_01755 [Mycobacterium sp.]